MSSGNVITDNDRVFPTCHQQRQDLITSVGGITIDAQYLNVDAVAKILEAYQEKMTKIIQDVDKVIIDTELKFKDLFDTGEIASDATTYNLVNNVLREIVNSRKLISVWKSDFLEEINDARDALYEYEDAALELNSLGEEVNKLKNSKAADLFGAATGRTGKARKHIAQVKRAFRLKVKLEKNHKRMLGACRRLDHRTEALKEGMLRFTNNTRDPFDLVAFLKKVFTLINRRDDEPLASVRDQLTNNVLGTDPNIHFRHGTHGMNAPRGDATFFANIHGGSDISSIRLEEVETPQTHNESPASTVNFQVPSPTQVPNASHESRVQFQPPKYTGQNYLNIRSPLNITEFLTILHKNTTLSALLDHKNIYQQLYSDVSPFVRYLSVLSTNARIYLTLQYFIENAYNNNRISFQDKRDLDFIMSIQRKETLTAANFERLLGIFGTIITHTTTTEPMSIYDHVLHIEDNITRGVVIRTLEQFIFSQSQKETMHTHLRKSTKMTPREFLDNLESDGLHEKNVNMLQTILDTESRMKKSAEDHFINLRHLGLDMENLKMLMELYYKQLPNDISKIEKQKVKTDPRFNLNDNKTFKINNAVEQVDWSLRMGLSSGQTEDTDEEMVFDSTNSTDEERTTHTYPLEMAKNVSNLSVEKSKELLNQTTHS